jgi:hypothetical protein
MSNLYSAIDSKGKGICTVIADNAAEAESKVSEELTKNPSRVCYLKNWVAAGSKVEEIPKYSASQTAAKKAKAKAEKLSIWKPTYKEALKTVEKIVNPDIGVKKGDTLSCSWGYDMTINNYCKVIGVSKTGKTVKCRMVEKITNGEEHGPGGSGKAKAGKKVYGPEFRLHVRGKSFVGSYPFIVRRNEESGKYSTEKSDCSYRKGYFSKDSGESYENHWD